MSVSDARVGWLIINGRKVRWECEVCRSAGPVDLVRIANRQGLDFSLANRRPRCRAPGCPGRARFLDASNPWPRSLDTLQTGSAPYWAYRDQEDARLAALGWRMVEGRWRPPEKM